MHVSHAVKDPGKGQGLSSRGKLLTQTKGAVETEEDGPKVGSNER